MPLNLSEQGLVFTKPALEALLKHGSDLFPSMYLRNRIRVQVLPNGRILIPSSAQTFPCRPVCLHLNDLYKASTSNLN